MVNYQMRIGMVMVLQNAIMQWNNGDSEALTQALININNTEGYGARYLVEEREIDGIVYNIDDVVFEILEDGEPLFSVYRDKRDNMMVLEVYPVDLLTGNELKVDYDLKMKMIEESLVC